MVVVGIHQSFKRALANGPIGFARGFLKEPSLSPGLKLNVSRAFLPEFEKELRARGIVASDLREMVAELNKLSEGPDAQRQLDIIADWVIGKANDGNYVRALDNAALQFSSPTALARKLRAAFGERAQTPEVTAPTTSIGEMVRAIRDGDTSSVSLLKRNLVPFAPALTRADAQEILEGAEEKERLAEVWHIVVDIRPDLVFDEDIPTMGKIARSKEIMAWSLAEVAIKRPDIAAKAVSELIEIAKSKAETSKAAAHILSERLVNYPDVFIENHLPGIVDVIRIYEERTPLLSALAVKSKNLSPKALMGLIELAKESKVAGWSVLDLATRRSDLFNKKHVEEMEKLEDFSPEIGSALGELKQKKPGLFPTLRERAIKWFQSWLP